MRYNENNNAPTLQDLALALTDTERQLADELLAREYAPKGEQLTYEEIAEKYEMSVRSLYNVRNKPAFLAYFRALSETRLATYHAKADAMLIKLIEGGNNGIGSIKALDLFYKLTNRLNSDSVVRIEENRTTPRLSDDQVAEELKQLSATLTRVK